MDGCQGFSILSETLQFKRYVRVVDRVVKYPNGTEMKFDVLVSKSNHFVTVVPFFTANQEFGMIREYAQGPNAMITSVACGGYEPSKHTGVRHAAECELSEECALKGGVWVKLIPEGSPGVMEAKWAAMRFTPFLVIDPAVDAAPMDQDQEEYIFQQRVSRYLLVCARSLVGARTIACGCDQGEAVRACRCACLRMSSCLRLRVLICVCAWSRHHDPLQMM